MLSMLELIIYDICLQVYKSTIMRYLLILALIFFGFEITIAQDAFSGNWKSDSPSLTSDGIYLVSEISFDKGQWLSEELAFEDMAKTKAIYIKRTVGSFEVAKDSKSKIDLTTERVFLTLLTDNQEMMDKLGFNYCSLKKGIEKDITDDGCASIHASGKSMKTTESFDIKGGEMHLGSKTLKKK